MSFHTIKWDGQPISKPGIYSLVPLSAYHSAGICDGPSVSSSGLRKLFSESPAHFYAEWPGNPERVPPKDAAHFIVGRAVHMLALGEPYFAKLFAIQPKEWMDKKTGLVNEWRRGEGGVLYADAWANQCRKDGRAIIKPDDVENIKGMSRQLAAHPLIRPPSSALNGQIERSMFWKDEATGLWVKARPDAIPGDSADFVDLKTTTSVIWPDLVRTIGDYGYHAQGALVRSGARALLKMKNATFTLVFVEKKKPWCVRVVTLKDSDLDRGERQNRAALDAVADCLKSGRWPGPGGDREDAEHIELSEYTQKQIDERLRFGIAVE